MDEGNDTSLSALDEKLAELRKKVMTLEWDKSHNQLNSSMESKYMQIRTEFEILQKKVDELKAELRAKEPAEPAKPEDAATKS